MQTHFLSTLNRWLRCSSAAVIRLYPPAVTETAPLDPVERLHRSGSTFPVVMEFSRLGW